MNLVADILESTTLKVGTGEVARYPLRRSGEIAETVVIALPSRSSQALSRRIRRQPTRCAPGLRPLTGRDASQSASPSTTTAATSGRSPKAADTAVRHRARRRAAS
jgi:hypothetical protein